MKIKKIVRSTWTYLIIGCIGIGASGPFLIPKCLEMVKEADKKEDLERCLGVYLKPSKDKIERIIASENTPKEAFDRVSKDLKFPFNDEELERKLKPCDGEGYYSIQESYAIGGGLCRDGVIAFTAMLSDNPEYEVKVVTLYLNNKRKHVIAIFKEDGQLGHVSFNDGAGKVNYSVFKPPKHGTIEELMSSEFKNYEAYGFYKMNAKEMKFGEAIRKIGIKGKKKIKK